MDKMNTEEFKENSAKSETGFSLMNLVMGIVMVVFGYQNLPAETTGTLVEDGGEEDAGDPCPNGAAYWLYVAGICLLVSNSINTWAKIYKKYAERDGKIDSGEKIVLGINKMSSNVMFLIEFVMLIWGSVVVFGAWATWTDDYEEFNANQEEMNYCRYNPMVFAFSILLVKWILIPVIIVLTCCCFFCGFLCLDLIRCCAEIGCCTCFNRGNTETA